MLIYVILIAIALYTIVKLYKYSDLLFAEGKNLPTDNNQTALKDTLDQLFISKNDIAPSQFNLLNNISLPINQSQIKVDSIIISTRGIFLIDVNNYEGQIRYSSEQGFTHKIANNTNKIFLSANINKPLVAKITNNYLAFINPSNIHFITLFPDTAEFKSIRPSHTLRLTELINLIDTKKDEISISQYYSILGAMTSARNTVQPAPNKSLAKQA